ncbi:MAG: chromosomal replication initiator protein DnaA [Proteobacteria bacterium]|nr:chromosomal replication initiator protein DnaA [Pseudomonadota bacterium]
MKTFWENFLNSIKEKTSAQIYESWFKPLQLKSLSASAISIEVPSLFFSDWLKENYMDIIKEVLFSLTGTRPEICFTIKNTPEQPADIADQSALIPKNINSRYVFNNFVVGSSNQFAHAACMAVSNHPGRTYNPLFMYGGVGLGKTHLLHAIVQQCLSNNSRLKICYTTAENFTNEMINSIRFEKMTAFRNKYRNMDMMLLDDIQFIAGKERTQEEFFHTFNALFELKKQLVVTSDKTPREIPGLEDRLRSRFEWGLIADIQSPDTETKVAILKKKAVLENIHLPNDVAFFLASNVRSNIRELEGFLNRLIAYSSLYGSDITLDFTKEVLKEVIAVKKETTPEDILKLVCKLFNAKVSDLKTKRKNSAVVLPRQVAMYAMRKLTTLSYPEIGQFFGGKDHSTVIHSIKKIELQITRDYKIKNIIDSIIQNF